VPETRAELAIERFAAGPFEVATSRGRVDVDRVEVATVEGEVEFAGFRPRAGRLAARGVVLKNLKIVAGALFALALVVACGGGDDEPIAVRADAHPAADAGPPGDARIGVDCRESQCTQEETCCGELIEPRHFIYECVQDDLAGDCAQIFDCDGPEDCPSGLCCAGSEVACAPPGEVACREGAPVCHQTSDCGGPACCPTPSGVVKECLGNC
jgi:hypothetical protein